MHGLVAIIALGSFVLIALLVRRAKIKLKKVEIERRRKAIIEERREVLRNLIKLKEKKDRRYKEKDRLNIDDL